MEIVALGLLGLRRKKAAAVTEAAQRSDTKLRKRLAAKSLYFLQAFKARVFRDSSGGIRFEVIDDEPRPKEQGGENG